MIFKISGRSPTETIIGVSRLPVNIMEMALSLLFKQNYVTKGTCSRVYHGQQYSLCPGSAVMTAWSHAASASTESETCKKGFYRSPMCTGWWRFLLSFLTRGGTAWSKTRKTHQEEGSTHWCGKSPNRRVTMAFVLECLGEKINAIRIVSQANKRAKERERERQRERTRHKPQNDQNAACYSRHGGASLFHAIFVIFFIITDICCA